MLGKEIKIATLMKQRRFIEEQLKRAPERSNDGDVSYRYVGHVYKENIKFFENEGFFIYREYSEKLVAEVHGLPVYVFVPDDEKLILTEEELNQSKETAKNTAEDEDNLDSINPLIRMFMEGHGEQD